MRMAGRRVSSVRRWRPGEYQIEKSAEYQPFMKAFSAESE